MNGSSKDFSLEEIQTILEGGDFDRFIGAREHSTFEVKSNLNLSTDHHKYTLARGLASLANHEGGIFIIGLVSEKSQETREDIIVKKSLMKESDFNRETYINITHDWIYPSPEKITVNWYKSKDNQDFGVVAITIPPQNDSFKPFLICRYVSEAGKLPVTLVGYSTRIMDRTTSESKERLHRLIRDGIIYEHHLKQLPDAIFERINSTRESVKPPQEPQFPLIDDRIRSAIEDAGLSEHPAFVLASSPYDIGSTVPSLFDRESDIVKLLLSPPILRKGGFDLRISDDSRIVRGQFRRLGREGSGLSLDLWLDGSLIFVAEGDEGHLCWPSKFSGYLRLNPYALTESIFLFAVLTNKISKYFKPKPNSLWFSAQIFRAITNETNILISANRRGSLPYRERHAPEQNMTCSIEWHLEESPPEQAGFLLLEKVYAWFGLERHNVWFVKEENGRPVIDPEKIKESR